MSDIETIREHKCALVTTVTNGKPSIVVQGGLSAEEKAALDRLEEQMEQVMGAAAANKGVIPERDCLREALREIAVYVPGNVHIGEAAVKLKDIARRALLTCERDRRPARTT